MANPHKPVPSRTREEGSGVATAPRVKSETSAVPTFPSSWLVKPAKLSVSTSHIGTEAVPEVTTWEESLGGVKEVC